MFELLALNRLKRTKYFEVQKWIKTRHGIVVKLTVA